MEMFDKVIAFINNSSMIDLGLGLLLGYEVIALRVKTSKSYSLIRLGIKLAVKALGAADGLVNKIDSKLPQ